MKKTIVFLLATLMVLNVGSCKKEKLNVNPDVIEEINTNYPGAEIIEENDGLGVIVDNMTYTSDMQLSQGGMGNGIVYNDIQDLMQRINLLNYDIVTAKKTGVSKQYMSIDERLGTMNWYHTETEVEITDVLYGDIGVGEKVFCQELYAVIAEEGIEKTAVSVENVPPLETGKEYLLVLVNGSESTLSKGRMLYGISSGVIPIDLSDPLSDPSKVSTVDIQVYEKYIVNRDIAIDEQEEIRKATEWKETLKERGVDVSETLTENELAMIGKAADKCGRIGTKTEHETK